MRFKNSVRLLITTSLSILFLSNVAEAALAGGIKLRSSGILYSTLNSNLAPGSCSTFEVVHVDASGAPSVPRKRSGSRVDIMVSVSNLPAGCTIYRSGCSGYSYGTSIPILGRTYSQTAKFFDVACSASVSGSASLGFSNATVSETLTATLNLNFGTTTSLIPAAPGNLAASPASSSSISLSWSDLSSNESGFRIYRSSGGAPFSLIATTAANSASFADSGLSPSTQYSYKVESFNTSGSSSQIGPVSATTLAASGGGGGGQLAAERGLWVWHVSNLLTSSADRTALFNYSLQNGFNVLYLSATSYVGSSTGRSQLSALIEAGAQVGLKFRLLMGGSNTTTTSSAISFLANSSSLKSQLSAAGQSALMGIQYDIETYQNGGDPAALAPIAIAVRSAQQSQYQNLILDFCIPRWFDSKSYNGRVLSEVIQDNSDIVTLMNYVDTSSRLISDAQNEINYATAQGKLVVSGVETQCGLGDGETFCEEGRAAMESALSAVTTRYSGTSGFLGNAVHYYDSLLTLIP